LPFQYHINMRKIYHTSICSKILVTSFLVFLFMVVYGFSASSQLPDSITTIKEKPEKLLKNLRIQNVTQGGFNFWQDEFSGHWAGIDFGFNTLTGKGLSNDYPAFLEHDIFRSNSLYVNIIQQSIGLQKTRNTIGLVTGIGLQFKSFRLNNNTTIEKASTGEINGKILVYDDNQKSKFSATYITAPLLLEFQVPVNHYANRLFISGGLFGGYRLASHTKIKYRIDRSKEKLKTPGDYSLNDFRYGIMARLGYRQLQVFVNYDLQPMFKDEARVDDVFPLTFGVTLLSF
jgi:hypothetical protein